MTSDPDFNQALDDSIDINPRPVGEIYRRAVALVTLARRGFFEESAPADQQSSDYYDVETGRFDLYSWSRRELDDSLTSAESPILRAPAGTLASDALSQCFDALIAAEVLAWSIGLIEMLTDPALPSEYAIELLLKWAPEPWSELKHPPKNLMVRNDQEIAGERERRELWYWRASVDPSDFQSHEELGPVIAETAQEARLAKLVHVADDDFAVDGKPFSSLAKERIAEIETISQLQLHALNWAAGLGDDWDSTPLLLD